MKQRIFIGCLCVVLMLSLVACGKQQTTQEPSQGEQQTEPVSTQPAEPDTSNGSSNTTEEFLRTITAETAEAKGVCGADLTWYYQDNVLVIKGTGEMTDYERVWTQDEQYYIPTAPWYEEYHEKIGRVIIGEGCTSIGNVAFAGLGNLSNATLPDTITNIGTGAFDECTNLREAVLPDELLKIGGSAFFKCEKLQEVILPSKVTEIGGLAFFGCMSLDSVALPEGLTVISASTFGDCEGIQKIVYPSTLATVEDSQHSYLRSLNEVTFLGNAPEGISYIIKNLNEGTTVYYHGTGFEEVIAEYPAINWVKQ